MRDSIKIFIQYISSFNLPEPIIEIGSRQEVGQIGYADMRPFFTSKEYIGCDQKGSIGVDRIEDAHHLSFSDNYVGTCLCLETIEHILHPTQVMLEIHRVLKKNGIVIISTHMLAPIHEKDDYWRFTPRCMHDILLWSFSTKEVYIQGEPSFPQTVLGIASKTSIPQINLQYLNSMMPFSYPFPFAKWEDK